MEQVGKAITRREKARKAREKKAKKRQARWDEDVALDFEAATGKTTTDAAMETLNLPRAIRRDQVVIGQPTFRGLYEAPYNLSFTHASMMGALFVMAQRRVSKAYPQGYCIPSHKWLGRRFNMSRRQVVTVTQKLRTLGLVEIEERAGPKYQHRYIPKIPRAWTQYKP